MFTSLVSRHGHHGHSRHRPRRWIQHPAQAVTLGFAAAIMVSTVLLWLPVSRTGDGHAPLVTALFTATSAVCVTGLGVVDTATYWSDFGEAVILVSIQIGGFGIMTLATLLGLLIARRMGLRTRLTAASETKAVGLGDVKTVVRGVVAISLICEAVLAAILTLRFATAYDESPLRALHLGVFHAVSSFNNAGFALWSDSLTRFATDPWICLPIAAAVILGGLGFPVILELRRCLRQPKKWTLHVRMTVSTTLVLLVLGTVLFGASEWTNPATLGQHGTADRLLISFFHSVMPRTAGFNTIDYGAANEQTLLITNVLMFIGGGSAGTAGGIKVTTFVLLLFAIMAEVRGEDRVHAFERRIGDRAIRQAMTVALLSVAAVMGGTMVMLALTDLHTYEALFEVTSAFATVGLSTGITADLPDAAQLLLVGLMYLGRLGPITLVSALALRERHRRFEYPEGRPIIG